MDWPCPDDSKKLRKGNENNDTKGEESEEKKENRNYRRLFIRLFFKHEGGRMIMIHFFITYLPKILILKLFNN